MKISDTPVTCLVDSKDKLGEGCFWDAATQCLWWLDLIVPSAIHRLHVASGVQRSARRAHAATRNSGGARSPDRPFLLKQILALRLFPCG